MNDLLVGALSALLATNQPAALSNLVKSATGITVEIADTNDPVEREFQKLMAEDDAAQAEVDGWIKENNQFAAAGAGVDSATLNARIDQRFAPVRKAYETFLGKRPKHAKANLAYASFLNEIGEEAAAFKYMEQAREADPKDPAAWNNLANWHGHNGPVAKSFEYYQKAIELNPKESVYYHNLATTVYLFRHDATNYYKLNVQSVFEKAMGLYRKALELDPENFVLATDYAQSYYGFSPPKTGDAKVDDARQQKHWQDAIVAWNSAMKLARDDIERQGVRVHFARINIHLRQFDEARRQLAGVTNEMFTVTKNRIAKNIATRESAAANPK